MSSRRPRTPFSTAVAAVLFALVANAWSTDCAAQCATQWLPGSGVPGTDGPVRASTMWDPDGAGPLQPRLVLGGEFTAAGTVVANRIAAYDPATGIWSTLGAGMDGHVHAVIALPNGDLVAGGDFTMAGGVGANRIARWNGTNWSAMGSGMNLAVDALTTLPNGNVVAGGQFFTAGAVSANRVARWNGTNWSAMGSGMDTFVSALTALPNGDVVAGGEFTTAGTGSAAYIARWNGISWSPLGTGMDYFVRSLTTLPNGDLVAGGSFSAAGGVTVNGIARWNGTSWSALGPGMNGHVHSLTTLPNGDLVAGGLFTAVGSVSANCIARWDGASWSALGSGIPGYYVYASTTLPNGDLAVGGWFTTAGGIGASHLARWNGASWSTFGAWGEVDGPVSACTRLPNGDLVVGGRFTTAGGVPANRIARWNGTTWSPLGSGLGGGSAPWVSTLATLPNGDLVAGGDFTTAGGVSANRIARWDGTSWSALGPGLGNYPLALAALPNGDVVIGGYGVTVSGGTRSWVARWDGSSWSDLGSGMFLPTSAGLGGASVRALLALPNGELVAGGQFTTADNALTNHIARWDGANWSALGAGLAGGPFPGTHVNALLTLPNGELVVGGSFATAGSVSANHIARWDGANWSALGSVSSRHAVTSLAMLPGGDLVAGSGANVVAGMLISQIERWNGASWTTLGSGFTGPFGHLTFVRALALLPNGNLLAGGDFTAANGAISPYLAQITTTCPATAQPAGAGCGVGTAPVLTATALPWLGSTCRTRGTGLPTSALVAAVTGLTPWSLALTSMVPQALPGCVLHVTPDAIVIGTAANGAFDFAFGVPNTAAFVGITLFHQMVVQELGAQQQLLAMTASNALQLTLGAF